VSNSTETLVEAPEFSLDYQKYRALIYAMAWRITRSATLADEVVQDVFVSLLRSPDRFDETRGSIQAYLSMIARHRAIDCVKSEASRRRREEMTCAGDSPDDAQDLIQAKAAGQRVHMALSSLSEVHQQIIRLVYLEGRTYASTAQHLNLPLGTVKTRGRNALKRLAIVMTDET
jgi:RNA polymerase sigma-70 factor, ECF subfamily